MGRGRSFGTAGWALTVLIGCAECATPFNPKDAAMIQAISFSGFDEPKYELTAFSPVSLLPSDIAGHPAFPDQTAKQNLHLGAEMKAAIAKELRNDGYNVLEGDGTGDAMLNFEFGGFPPATTPAYSAGAGNYEPEFMATATLRDAKSKKALFQRVYVYRDNSCTDRRFSAHPARSQIRIQEGAGRLC
jgi:hypothetical protein